MKYTFEIMKEYEDAFRGISVYSVSEDKKLIVDFVALEELEDAQKEIDEAYHRGLEEGKKATWGLVADASSAEYQRGFEDGKGAIHKGCEGCKFANVAGTHEPCVRCSNNYPNHWTAKDDKIEVGDEVIYNGTTKCIVVRQEDDERYASLIDSDGTHYSADHRECKQTGRHFNIDKILEEIKE